MDNYLAIPLNDLSNYLGRDNDSAGIIEDANPAHNPEFSLPRADGGKDAWLFLAACFVVEALVWGSSLYLPTNQHVTPISEPH